MQTSASNVPKRLHSLDAVRGVAALGVVFWHWQHFFFAGFEPPADFKVASQPLYQLFFLSYRNGYLAVDLFFCLSGFIFYWLYSESIADRKTDAREFFLLRFSRLYPLHLVTLLLVAFGQYFYTNLHGQGFAFPANDSYHFVLNLFFASSVGLEQGLSFNSPTWSVSVEVFLYILFFMVCRWSPPRTRLIVTGVLSVVGILVLPRYLPLGRGLLSFFLGGCLYHLYLPMVNSRMLHRWADRFSLLAVVLWIASIVFAMQDHTLVPRSPLWMVTYLFPRLVLFPVTILALALVEAQRGELGRRLSFLGDISYSVYLWHFPLQLLCAYWAERSGLGQDYFRSPLVLGVFMCYLMIISIISHRYLEMPAQRWLRGRRPAARVLTPLATPDAAAPRSPAFP